MGKAISQSEHIRINTYEYPGTRQLCSECGEPTGRCEDDAIYTENGFGPLCEECYRKTDESKIEQLQSRLAEAEALLAETAKFMNYFDFVPGKVICKINAFLRGKEAGNSG